MSVFAKPVIAIAFGAFMLCADTCLHAEALLNIRTDWPALPIHGWSASSFLIVAGIARRADWSRRTAYQAAAWAFTLSLLVGALFSWIEEWLSPPDTVHWFTEGTYVVLVSILAAVALGGLVSTLANRVKDES